ncbi:hypothetical protein BX600DRAFT_475885 [Xylariales sp. PMI_506]|nr:hypothetical protein BX600DRAFT_475885 [Xylariales sp. PMI_506]
MVRLKEVQGRIYKFKSNSESGFSDPTVPDIVRKHMVLVVDITGKKDHVKVMTITSTLTDDGDYVPISPTPKRGFAIQLRLRNYSPYAGVLHISTLPLKSYLKIDSSYRVPIQALEQATDYSGNDLMVWASHQGGLKELRDHIRRRDQARVKEAILEANVN